MIDNKGLALGWDSLFTVPVAVPFAVAVKLYEGACGLNLKSSGFLSLLWYLETEGQGPYRGLLIDGTRRYLSSNRITPYSRQLILKGLVAFGVGASLHRYLNRLAQNNFRLRSEASKYDWPNEIAVVTGAAGGIGSAMVKELAAKGVNVMAVDIAPSLPDELAQNKKVSHYKCDITNRQDVLDLAATIKKEHGTPSILCNNAGVAYMHHTLNASETALRRLFDVNIIGHYWTLQAFLPDMIAQKKGHIASTASMGSFYPGVGLTPYCATKAAVMALHEGLQQEMRQVYHAPEVKLTIVHPTFVQTAMARGVYAELKKVQEIITPESVSRGVCENIFAGRGGQVVLSSTLGVVPGIMRALPHWLRYSLLRVGETQRMGMSEEETPLK